MSTRMNKAHAAEGHWVPCKYQIMAGKYPSSSSTMAYYGSGDDNLVFAVGIQNRHFNSNR